MLKLPEDVVTLLPTISGLDKNSPDEDWLDCIEILDEYHFYLCYSTGNNENTLFPNKCWTFQHHVAYHNAPQCVVEELNNKHFPFSFKDSHGKMPIDYVHETASPDYRKLFKPKYLCRDLTPEKISKIEKNFHAIVTETSGDWAKRENIILPILSIYYEQMNYENQDFEVCYMLEDDRNGGFYFHSEFNEDQTDVEVLIVERYLSYTNGRFVFGNRYRVTENNWTIENQ